METEIVNLVKVKILRLEPLREGKGPEDRQRWRVRKRQGRVLDREVEKRRTHRRIGGTGDG